MKNPYPYLRSEKHYLKHPSSFIVVVLRSLRHGACVNCGESISTLDESAEHWERKLKEDLEAKEK